MSKYFKILEEIWVYYFSSLEIEPYEYDVYVKIIDKIKNKEFDFTEQDKNNILKLIKMLQFVCDEYEIKILEKIQQTIGVSAKHSNDNTTDGSGNDGCNKYKNMSFNFNKCEKAIGPLFACQLSIKSFIEDITNDIAQREYAETIYEWLGTTESSIDELCAVSYDKSLFILKALEKYGINTNDSNIILNYGDAIGSLKYQIDLIKKSE